MIPYLSNSHTLTSQLHYIQNRENAYALLRSYARKIKQVGLQFKAIATNGDPREEIARKCRDMDVDLLIVGFRGTGGSNQFFLGSVARISSFS